MTDLEKTKKCFVITPIGGETTDVRKKTDGLLRVLEPIVTGFGYEFTVSHKKYESDMLITAIIKEINNSDVIIANISNDGTASNPNVMYELGIADTIGKHVIIIAEGSSTVASDITMKRRLTYEDSFAGLNSLEEAVTNMLTAIEAQETVSNPVTEALHHVNVVKSTENDVEENQLLLEIHKAIQSILQRQSIRMFSDQGGTQSIPDGKTMGKIMHIAGVFGRALEIFSTESEALSRIINDYNFDTDDVYSMYNYYIEGHKKICDLVMKNKLIAAVEVENLPF